MTSPASILLFDPAVDAHPEHIVIKIPDAGKHFREVFRDFRA
jgi:hypothetical protein